MTSADVGAGTRPRAPGLASMLYNAPSTSVEAPRDCWGFGGLHGGLALAMAAALMEQSAPGQELRSVTGQFHRPIRTTVAIDANVIRAGRSASAAQAAATGPEGICLSATGILGVDQPGAAPFLASEAPDVPGPGELLPLANPEGWAPVLSQVEIRPVHPIRPYAGAGEPVNTAWMRLRDSDEPINRRSLIFFLDVLPPSYANVLTEQRPVPTLDFSAHLTSNELTSPWVLVRSRTTRASSGGWVTELMDAWDPDRVHLATAQQLRLAPAPRYPAETRAHDKEPPRTDRPTPETNRGASEAP